MMWKLQRICILKKKLKFWQQFFSFSRIGTHYTISLVKAIQQWWHLPVDHSANYYLWTPSWHPAGGESYWDNWNCACFGQGFFFHRGKKKRKDEVGQSGVLPFSSDASSFPVSFWDESSRAHKVQVKALFSIREDENQTQLGVESILCAGRIHGYRPTLCRKGRGFK